MNQDADRREWRSGVTISSCVVTALGIGLLVWLVKKVGLHDVAAGLKQVGPGFVVILALALVRHAVRAKAWTLLMNASERIPLTRAMAATISGEAVGQTPLSVFVSEPTKALYVISGGRPGPPAGSGRLDVRAHGDATSSLSATHAFAALAAENLCYAVSVALWIVVGTIALLLAFPISHALRVACIASLAAMLATLTMALWIVWREPAVVSAMLARVPTLGGWVAHVRDFEHAAYRFVREGRRQLGPVLLCEATFHASSVAEIYATLFLLTGSASLLTAVILDSVQRVINIIFRVVPMRVGVDEAGAALVAQAIGLGSSAGILLALVRKARVVVITAIGVVLLIRRGLTLKTIIRAGRGA
jgi:hypothetical protein